MECAIQVAADSKAKRDPPASPEGEADGGQAGRDGDAVIANCELRNVYDFYDFYDFNDCNRFNVFNELTNSLFS